MIDYVLHFEDLQNKIPVRVGRANMPKVEKTKREKTTAEHIKDIVIAVLVTGIIAFIGGMQYASALTARPQVVGDNATESK